MPDHTFPLIEVEGSSYEMGYQHGAQAAGLVQRYLRWIDRLTGMSRDTLCRNAMGFWPLMERLSPAFSEEVRGLADGAGISLEEAVLCQAPRRGRTTDGRGLHRLRADAVGHGRWKHAGGTEPGPRAGIRRRRPAVTGNTR